MEMRVVCYCVKAYLHCAVKLSLVTTACLLTLALKFIFACRAVWFRHVRDIFGEKVQRRQIAFTLTGSCVCLLLQCTYEPLNTYKPPFAKRRLCTRPMKRCMLCLVKFHRRNRQYIVHFNQVIWKPHALHPSLSFELCIHQWWKLLSSSVQPQQSQINWLYNFKHIVCKKKDFDYSFKGFVCFVAAASLVHLLRFWLKFILSSGWFDKKKSAR